MLTNIHSIKTTKISCEKENVDNVQDSSRISKFQAVKQEQNGAREKMIGTKSLQKIRRTRGISRTLSAAKFTENTLKKQQLPSGIKSRYNNSRLGLQVTDIKKQINERENSNDAEERKLSYHTTQRVSPMKCLLQQDEYRIMIQNRNPSPSSEHKNTQTIQNQAKQLKFGKSHYSNQLQFCHQKIHYLQQQLVIIQKEKIQLENQVQYHQSQIRSLKQINNMLQDELQRNRNNIYSKKNSPNKKSHLSKSKSPKKGIQLTQSPKKKMQGQIRLLNQIDQLIGKNKQLASLNEERSKQISQLEINIQNLRSKLRDSVRQQEEKLQTIFELQRDLTGYTTLKEKCSQYEARLESSKHTDSVLKRELEELRLFKPKSVQPSNISNLQLQLNRLKRKCQFAENQLQIQRKRSKRAQVQFEEIAKTYERRIIERQQQILKQQKIIRKLNQDIKGYIESSTEIANNFSKTNGSVKQNVQAESLVYQLMGQSPGFYKQMHEQLQMISIKKEQLRQENNILRQQLAKVLYEIQICRRDIQQLINLRNSRDKQLLDLKKQLEIQRAKSVQSNEKENQEIKMFKSKLGMLNKQNEKLLAQNEQYKQLISQIQSQKERQVNCLKKQIQQLEQLMKSERTKLQQQNYRRLTQMESIFQRNRNISSTQLLNKVQQLQRRNQTLNTQLQQQGQNYNKIKIAMQQEYETIIYNFKQALLKAEQEKLSLIQYNRNLQQKQQRNLEELNFQRKEIQNHYQAMLQARRLSNSNRKRSISRSPPSKYIPEQQDISALRREIDFLKVQLTESKTKTKDLINKMNNHTYERQKNEEQIKESKRKIRHLEDQLMHLKIDKEKIYKEKVDLLQLVNQKQQKQMELQQNSIQLQQKQRECHNLIKSLQDRSQLYLRQLKELSQIQRKYEVQLGAKLDLTAKLKNLEQVIEKFKNQNSLIEDRYKSFVNLNEKYKSQIVYLEKQVIKYKQLTQILKKEKNSFEIKTKIYHSESIKPLQAIAADRGSREKVYERLATIKSEWFTINYREGQSEYEFLMTLFEKTKLLCQYYHTQMRQKMDLKDKLKLYDQVCNKYQEVKLDYEEIKSDYHTVYQKYLKYKQIARYEKQKAKQGHRMISHNRRVHDDYLQHCHKLIHERV